MSKIVKTGFVFLSIFLFACSGTDNKVGINLNSGWKFIKGDSLAYASPGFDDSKWDTIQTGRKWEDIGYDNYDGYAWYRVSFNLPSSFKDNAVFKDSLIIKIGRVDDCEQTFLNGKLIGQNGELVPVAESEKPGAFEGDATAYSKDRTYIISVDDPRVLWDKVNVIAVRVSDHGGGGGIYTLPQYIGIKDIQNYVYIDCQREGVGMKDGRYSKTLYVKNDAGFVDLKGSLKVEVIDNETNAKLFESKFDINVAKNDEQQLAYTFETSSINAMAVYTFTEEKTGHSFSVSEDLPYVLTPKPAETPRINGAKVYGVRPGSPALFRISATGVKPITFSAEGLPAGLTLDAATGVITGKIDKAGEYKLTVKAVNEKGSNTRELKIVAGDKLMLTPPLGWNSWNCWGLSIDEEKVKAAADNMIKSGLADHGWTYVNMDDGWEAESRDAKGNIAANSKFKDMKALSEYVHALGLKLGIYSSPGPRTCGQYLGSFQHEEQDAKTYSDWGIDYLKYDWCSYSEVAKDVKAADVDWNGDPEKMKAAIPALQKPYFIMRDALKKQKRDIVYSLCQYGWGHVWEWGNEANGNLWRTTGDIVDTWESMSGIGFRQDVCAPYCKPGNFNDPDMLVVGMVGWGPALHPTRLTASEQYTHISLWALQSAPLLIGCDLSRLDDFTLNLLTNDEVIDIDQDPLCKAAMPLLRSKTADIWVKELEDGSKAIGIFNLETKLSKITVKWSDLKLEEKQSVRDVWRQKDLGDFTGQFEVNVPAHGVCLIKVVKK